MIFLGIYVAVVFFTLAYSGLILISEQPDEVRNSMLTLVVFWPVFILSALLYVPFFLLVFLLKKVRSLFIK